VIPLIDAFYFLRGLVYAQSFFWVWLLRRRDLNAYFFDELKPFIVAIWGVVYLELLTSGFSFNHYTNEILRLYTVMVGVAVLLYSRKFDVKDALCYAFLTVFINSYFWEISFHFNKILVYGINPNDVIQGFHLITAYLFYREITITNWVKVKKWLIWGTIASTLNVLSITILPRAINLVLRGTLNDVNRCVCFAVLGHLIYNYTTPKTS